jgi:hypothetical protein
MLVKRRHLPCLVPGEVVRRFVRVDNHKRESGVHGRRKRGPV